MMYGLCIFWIVVIFLSFFEYDEEKFSVQFLMEIFLKS